MNMYNPPHVGRILREYYFKHLDISITEAANVLGVTRQALSNLLREKSGISAEMAIRLSKAFNNSPEYWMNLQKNYDLWQANKSAKRIKIKPFILPNFKEAY